MTTKRPTLRVTERAADSLHPHPTQRRKWQVMDDDGRRYAEGYAPDRKTAIACGDAVVAVLAQAPAKKIRR